MKTHLPTNSFLLLLFVFPSLLAAGNISLKINSNYLNFPVAHNQQRAKMTFSSNDSPDLNVVIRLAADKPDYWVFKDVSHLKGKTLHISYEGDSRGLEKIYQDNVIAGYDSLYKEKYRPQFHFTSRRGWINDPNGLIYHNGEYHLYYQHNPYEKEWENMHWGHAVSNDLIHWKELPVALFPDNLGTMFSGSAVIDYNNTAGFNKAATPAMIVFYTAASSQKQVQCMAYSLDNGRTFTKYTANPVIDSKEKWNSIDTRDPKVFWYAPGGHWVMILNERDGHSIYTSSNLKEWNYESHVTGFWECPELVELAVDGSINDKRWVMYGASGTYMIGKFNGKVFTPLAGKYLYTKGSVYAAQIFNNMTDGRRVQIGWGRIGHPGMPFNGMMLLPTELTLRSTKEGVRLFSEPVREAEQLFSPLLNRTRITAEEAGKELNRFKDAGCLRIKTTFTLSHATDGGLSLCSQRIVDYDLNNNLINGTFYSPDDRTSMSLTADIYIDRTSVEVFIDGGAFSYSMERKPGKNSDGFQFFGNRITVDKLEVFSVKPIW